MVSLLDITPTADTVEVDGKKISVPGISVEGLVSLLRRFPVLRDMLNTGKLNAETLSTNGPQVVAAVIAAGCGNPGDEKAEHIAGQLNLAAQVELLDAVLRRTLPKGVGPFVETLNRLMAAMSDPVDIVQAKLQQMKASPKPSKPSSDGAAMPREMSGL